jgi:hypothetical protein
VSLANAAFHNILHALLHFRVHRLTACQFTCRVRGLRKRDSCKRKLLQQMTSIRRRCLPPFTFKDFVARLMPWLWIHNSLAFLKSVEKNITHKQRQVVHDHTGGSLSVMNSDLKHLTLEEAEQIINQFENIPQSSDRLLFWTGIPRDWVQRWADEHGMLTLTSAMGPLMDANDQRCPMRGRGPKKRRSYIKGASGIFARYACEHGIVRVLTLPPSRSQFLRSTSSYRTIEEPVLKGSSGCYSAVQINFVHLLIRSQELEYQIWPEDHTSETLECNDADSLEFKLPPWIIKALKFATGNTVARVVNLTTSTPSDPGIIDPVSPGTGQRPSFSPMKQPQDEIEHQKSIQALERCRLQQGLSQTAKSPVKANTREVQAGKPQDTQQLQGTKQPPKNAQPQSEIISQNCAQPKRGMQSQSNVQPPTKKPPTKKPQENNQSQKKKQQARNPEPTKRNASLKHKEITNEGGARQNDSATNIPGKVKHLRKSKKQAN